MNRLRVLPALLLLVVTALLAAARAAGAVSPVDTAVAALRSDPVYVDPAAEKAGEVDANAVRAAIRSGSAPIYVAVLPAAAATEVGGPSNLPRAIGERLGRPATVAVVADSSFRAESNALPSGEAGRLATQAFSRAGSQGVTATLTDFVRAVQAARPSGAGSGSAPSGAGTSSSGGGGGVAVLLVLLLLGVLAVGGLALARRRRQQRELGNLRADVQSVLDRLGADVTTLNPGDNAVAAQAINDASERYTAAASQMASADTKEKFAIIRRTALEGLAMTRAARKALGLDPGPEIAPEEPAGQQLTAAQRVQVGDQELEGYPDYRPGAPYYYRGGMLGGSYVPGGWYPQPFWSGALLGGALGLGLGGAFGGLGGGYGSGYDHGFEQGREEAMENERYDGGGGDWGGDSGGGDWGGGDSGGGDWGGGDVGGGDW